jgi:hypothetical protein
MAERVEASGCQYGAYNLNLDMCAGDDMALLDGLDIDLDNMDDIAGMDDAKIEPLAAQMEMDDVSMPEAEAEVESQTSKRRKPKRKTKAPFFFDEDDDEYVDEKKKKKKGARYQRRGSNQEGASPAPNSDSNKYRTAKTRQSHGCRWCTTSVRVTQTRYSQ